MENNSGFLGTVLVIDDDPAIRLLAKASLELSGFQIVDADAGSAALELFDSVNPDIVMIDIFLPGGDGLSVCSEIRNHPRGCHTPIVVMTAANDLEYLEKAYQSGATDFIGKPCNWMALGYRLRYLLRTGNLLRQLTETRASLNEAQCLSKIGSWEWDVTNDVMYWSEAMYQIFRVDPIGFDKTYQAFINCVHTMNKSSVHRAFLNAIDFNQSISIDHNILISDGSTRYLHTEAKVVEERDGRAGRIAGTVQDITDRKLSEERMARLAYYDGLTGLPNRSLFRENLAHALGRARHGGQRVAVMFLDMDRFKEINDTLGHDTGDRLLQGFADRLTRCVRKINRDSDLIRIGSDCPVARLGGDEFTVILDGLSHSDDARKVAERIIDNVANPYHLDGNDLSVTVSIGISLYPDDGTDIRTLLKKADNAMYEAKNQGRNRYAFAEPSGGKGAG